VRLQELDAARSLYDTVLQAQIRRLGPDHADTRKAREDLADVQVQLGGQLGESPLVPELHQDAAMDDYGDALLREARPRGMAGAGSLWSRTSDELLALDSQLAGARPAQR